MVYLILVGYIVLTLFISLVFTRKPENNPESYFLSNRNLKTIALFFTLIATNFSAFFFLGFAGEGYRVGYAYYPMMAFGTSFAAVSFYLIGNKAWHLGKKHGFITPVEMIRSISGSRSLAIIYMIFMVGFMLPFLAVQPIGAGLILEQLTGGEISYLWGVIIMTAFIILYVYLGGMKGVVAMDMKNGIIMLSFMLLAIIAISYKMGGATAVNTSLFEQQPTLFSTRGENGFFTPLKWISFMFLWLACLPMFPQIFSRFLMSKDLKTFKQSTLLYTLIPTFLFIIPVMIGVSGHVDFTALAGKESDKILPMMLAKHTPLWIAALVLTGALAAFISTVDSLILALSTILTRDVYMEHFNKDISHSKQVQIGKLIVLVLSLISMFIALERPASIFKMVTMTFSGSALLFPVTLALFYWKRTSAVACMIALIAGELLLAALTFKWIDTTWIRTALPVLPALVCTSLIILFLSFFFSYTNPANKKSPL